jgi:hypothetical protein
MFVKGDIDSYNLSIWLRRWRTAERIILHGRRSNTSFSDPQIIEFVK